MKWLWVTGITVLISSSLLADGLDPLWEKYMKAKVTFHNDLADLLVKIHPEFEDLIVTSRDLQITMAKIRKRKYYYLLKNDSDKISRDKGAIQWANFEWTEEDNRNLLDADPEYVELTTTKSRLKEKNQKSANWPAARDPFAEVMKKKEYKSILKTLMDTISEIDEELKKTR